MLPDGFFGSVSMSAPHKFPRTRLYVAAPLSKGIQIGLDEKQSHYIAHVMRYGEGNYISLFNGKDGEWRAEIESIVKKKVSLRLLSESKPQRASPDLWLLAAPLRSGKTEFVIEKATELGISRFIPIFTQFTVVTSVNQGRLNTTAIEAAQQCERMDIPVIDSLIALPKLLDVWDKGRTIVYGDESGAGKEAKELLPCLSGGKYAVLIGPEGGFAWEELELLRSLDFTSGVSMGPRILRADTAAIAAVTLMQSWLGDWADKPAFRHK